nr:hypothetical protein [Micromonospora sp. DSM 115978]
MIGHGDTADDQAFRAGRVSRERSSKLIVRVRFPSPAPRIRNAEHTRLRFWAVLPAVASGMLDGRPIPPAYVLGAPASQVLDLAYAAVEICGDRRGQLCTPGLGLCRVLYMTRWTGGDPLVGLPASFTRAQARRVGLTDRQLYGLRDRGVIEAVGRGLFRRIDVDAGADIDLLEITQRAPRSTLCLTAALARHGLTDEIPNSIDVALPRGQYRPVTMAPATWHLFDRATFDVGRTELSLDRTTSIGLYGPERCIIDAIRLRHQEGPELGYGALKRWLRRPGAMPSDLLRMAGHFPAVVKALREALEMLL